MASTVSHKQRERAGWLSALGIFGVLLCIFGWWLGETHWISTRSLPRDGAAEIVPALGKLVGHDDWPAVTFGKADVAHLRSHLHYSHLFAIRLHGIEIDPDIVSADKHGRGIHTAWKPFCSIVYNDDEWPHWIESLNREVDGGRPHWGMITEPGHLESRWYVRDNDDTFTLWIASQETIRLPTSIQCILDSVGYERTFQFKFVGSEYREWSRVTIRVRD